MVESETPCNECERLCNKCGANFKASTSPFKPTTHIDVAWGYNSMGKDTLKDSWQLCSGCTRELDSLPPVCVQCQKTIPEVMAYLYSESPGTSFYLDYAGGLEYFKTPSNHCGYEYAMIGDRVLCEICYEAYVRSFKIPMTVDCYMGKAPSKEEMDKQPDRIKQAQEYVCRGDSLRDFYEARCNREETLAIRAAADREERVEALRVEIYKTEDKKRWAQSGDPYYLEDVITLDSYVVTLPTGEIVYLKITCRKFLEEVVLRGLAGVPVDFTQPALSKDGKHISFGAFTIDSKTLIQMAQEYTAQNKED